jgi:RimJ/RimL family protein N-acetyltransferase
MIQQIGVMQNAQIVKIERIKRAGAEKGGGNVGQINISSVMDKISKMMQKDERMLNQFRSRLIQAQYLERPKLRWISTAGQHIGWHSDQMTLLREQMREVERVYGGDVQLRCPEESDIRRIWRWNNEPETRHLLHRPVQSLQEWTTDIYRWLADDDVYPFVIDKSNDETIHGITAGGSETHHEISVEQSEATHEVTVERGEHIGFLMLRREGKPWEKRIGELNFVIMEETHRELGYGTKSVKMALQKAFEEIDVDMVYLWTISDNHAAIRCFEKCGFKFTDVERDNIAYDGERYDTFRMEIEKEAWREFA